jgi:hypothetical protein
MRSRVEGRFLFLDWPRWPRHYRPPSCRYQRLRPNSPARRPLRPLVPRLLALRRRAHRPARSGVSSGAQPAPSGVKNGARAEPIAVSPAARAEKRGVSSGGRPEPHNEQRLDVQDLFGKLSPAPAGLSFELLVGTPRSSQGWLYDAVQCVVGEPRCCPCLPSAITRCV